MAEFNILNNKETKKELGSIAITTLTPRKLVEKLGAECTQCNQCCKVDSGLVLDEDIDKIADHVGIPRSEFVEEFLVPHEKFNKRLWKLKQIREPGKPYGRCVFLDDEKGCTIHSVKPTHCRVCSTKSRFGEQLSLWFVLNHIVDADDPEAIRQWATYLKTHPTIPGGELHELVPDKERLRKILAYQAFR